MVCSKLDKVSSQLQCEGIACGRLRFNAIATTEDRHRQHGESPSFFANL